MEGRGEGNKGSFYNQSILIVTTYPNMLHMYLSRIHHAVGEKGNGGRGKEKLMNYQLDLHYLSGTS